MMTVAQLSLFVIASIVLIFTPGPDIIYVMTRGMAQGKKAALAAAAGFALGNFAHILFAVIGLSALLMSSATAFQAVKLAGAAYLIYLGIKIFRSGSPVSTETDVRPMSGWTIFRQSVVANILNPKVAVFFLAFFPQFIRAENGNPQLQMVALGCLFVVLVWICFSMIGLGSGWIGAWLRRSEKAEAAIGRTAGSILIALGLKLAIPDFR